MRRLFLSLLASLVLTSSAALAGTYSLTGNQRWIALASRQSLDEAIGIARAFVWRMQGVRVMQASNGWYAVVVGPHEGTDIRGARDKLAASGAVPKDILLSNGNGYVAEVWTKKEPELQLNLEYEGDEKSIVQNFADLRLTLSRQALKEGDGYNPTLSATRAGKEIINLQIEDVGRDEPSSELWALRLDPDSPTAQLVFTAFTGGAHCCTDTKFITQVGNDWRVIDGELLDGGGYWFEDIDGDGVYEIISLDNSFHYAYASYAESRAPQRISTLRNGQLQDVTSDPKFTSWLRQNIVALEYQASMDADLWRSNGFLAAWVAYKASVGELDQAWAKMMVSYNSSSDWPLIECMAEREKNGSCPVGKEITLSFPSALRKHLQRAGYIDAPAVPSPAAQAPVLKISPAAPSSAFSVPP